MAKNFKVYFVRHGQTIFNVTKQTQGWCDSPLTALGIQQAKNLKNSLKNKKFDKVFSSTSERAMDTCEIIIGSDSYQKSKLFKEMNFGDLEGHIEKRAGTDEKFIELSKGYKEMNGESAEELNQRIVKALEYIQTCASDEDSILVVSHGIFITYLICMFTSISFYDFMKNNQGPVSNGSITILEYSNDKYHMVKYNSKDFEEL